MRRATLARAVAVLSATQILGWGTTFYLPAVLAPAMAAGTGIPTGLVFGGVTVMLLVGGFIAPAAGRAFARHGTRPFMAAGSCLLATGLAVLSQAEGPGLFVLGWVLLGIGMPGALGQAASASMVQLAPTGARGAITVLLLFSGMTSTASWPVLIWLEGALGWRGSLLVYAGLHLFVAAPLHWFGPPSPPGPDAVPAVRTPSVTPEAATPSVPVVPGAYLLTATAFSLIGITTWGLPLQLILMLRGFGHDAETAVAIGTLFGPGQVLARLFELAGGHRLRIMTVGLLSMGLIAASLAVLLVGGTAPLVALGFVLAYGFAAGLGSIARTIVPLKLFGPRAYATMAGRLALPQNLAFGLSPLLLATVREEAGSRALVALAAAVSLGAFGTMAVLAARVRRAERGAQPVRARS